MSISNSPSNHGASKSTFVYICICAYACDLRLMEKNPELYSVQLLLLFINVCATGPQNASLKCFECPRPNSLSLDGSFITLSYV